FQAPSFRCGPRSPRPATGPRRSSTVSGSCGVYRRGRELDIPACARYIDAQGMQISKDLVAASATPVVLSLLARKESYGYAIIQDVRALSGGKLDWSDGMLYPILHRLEQRKLIRSYVKDSP